jgi:hypothetical protein
MRPELPTAVALDNSASIQPARSIFISWGKSVQISGATSVLDEERLVTGANIAQTVDRDVFGRTPSHGIPKFFGAQPRKWSDATVTGC